MSIWPDFYWNIFFSGMQTSRAESQKNETKQQEIVMKFSLLNQMAGTGFHSNSNKSIININS